MVLETLVSVHFRAQQEFGKIEVPCSSSESIPHPLNQTEVAEMFHLSAAHIDVSILDAEYPLRKPWKKDASENYLCRLWVAFGLTKARRLWSPCILSLVSILKIGFFSFVEQTPGVYSRVDKFRQWICHVDLEDCHPVCRKLSYTAGYPFSLRSI